MVFYAITDKDEELGFTPVHLIWHIPKQRKYSPLYPQPTRKDLAKLNPSYILNRIEMAFAGLEPVQNNNSSNPISPKLEQIVFE